MPYNGSALRGHIQTGDPFLGDIVKGIGGIAKTVGGFIPGPIGTVARAAGGLLAPGRPRILPPAMPGGIMPFGPGPPGPALGRRVMGQRKRPRMNPLNPKAVRRATRRLTSFSREVKKVEKALRRIAPATRRSAPRRDLPPGHTHVR